MRKPKWSKWRLAGEKIPRTSAGWLWPVHDYHAHHDHDHENHALVSMHGHACMHALYTIFCMVIYSQDFKMK